MMIVIVAVMIVSMIVMVMTVVMTGMIVPMPMSMSMIVGLEESTHPGDEKPCHQGSRQEQAVVSVKLKLWKKVRCRDADERSGTQGECVGGEVMPCPDAVDEEEEEDPERDHQSEQNVRENDASTRGPAHPHDGRDGEGVERLVKQNREKRTKSGKPCQSGRAPPIPIARLHRMLHLDRGTKSDSRKQGVNGHSEEGPHPSHGVITLPADVVPIRGDRLSLVMMKAEETFEKEDQQETQQECRGHA